MRLHRLLPSVLVTLAGCSTEAPEDEGLASTGELAAATVPISIPANAPYDTWTFIPVPGMKCANGTPTGFAINPHQGSTRLLVSFRGGGKCADYTECIATQGSSFVVTGYGPQQFAVEKSVLLTRGTYQRNNAQNPFRDFNMVYVPLCTGDMHTGNRVTYYAADGGPSSDAGGFVHHKGAANVQLMLDRVAPTFASSTTQLVVAGGSAGGFGAAWNFTNVTARFTRAGIDKVLIDDSGPFMTEPFFSRALLDHLETSWGYSTTVTGCTTCKPDAGGFWPIYRHNARTVPGSRASVVSSTRDTTVSSGFAKSPGNPNLACTADGGGPCEYEAGLRALIAGPLADAGVKVWVIESAAHVWLDDAPGTVTSQGVPLTTFLNRQLSNDPQWRSVVPP